MIDCANVKTASRKVAVAYFTDTTRILGDLGKRAGVGHHVVLGMAGADVVRFGYSEGKLAQEEAALNGPIPATVLRAAQFHEFAGQTLDQLRLSSVSVVPNMLIQPIAADEVAVVLATAVEAGPAGRAADVVGPGRERLPDMARRLARHRGQDRMVWALRVPGAAGRSMRSGGFLPGPGADRRGPSFDDWLQAQANSTRFPAGGHRA